MLSEEEIGQLIEHKIEQAQKQIDQGETVTSGKYILNEDREPVVEESLEKWSRWYETADVIIRKSMINDCKISTVFLGADHRLSSVDNTLPILFETMIFGGEHDQYQERYTSKQGALNGHERAVALVKGSELGES